MDTSNVIALGALLVAVASFYRASRAGHRSAAVDLEQRRQAGVLAFVETELAAEASMHAVRTTHESMASQLALVPDEPPEDLVANWQSGFERLETVHAEALARLRGERHGLEAMDLSKPTKKLAVDVERRIGVGLGIRAAFQQTMDQTQRDTEPIKKALERLRAQH